MKLDLHVHTVLSDGDRIDRIIAVAEGRRLDGIAITDHDTIRGVRIARKIAKNLLIIPGIEVATNIGHILILNISKMPRKNRYHIYNYIEILEWARENNATTILAHPITSIPQLIKNREIIEKYKPDAVEVYNSLYPFFPLSVTLSKRIAGKLNLPQTGGSDAHKYSQVGKCYTLVNSEKNIEEIMEKIRGGLIESSGRPAEIRIRTKISINFLTTFIPKIIDLDRNHHLLANKILEYEQ